MENTATLHLSNRNPSGHRLAICIVGMTVYSIPMTIIGPALPSIQADFKLSLEAMGLLASISFVGGLFAVLGGMFADRYGSLKTFLLGFALILMATSTLAFARSLILIPLSFFIIALGGSYVEPSMNSIVSVAYPDQRATALNILHVFWSVGAFIGPSMASIIITETGSWRYAYMVSAVIVAVFFSFMLASRSLTRMSRYTTRESNPRGNINWKIFGSSNLRLLSLIALFYVGAELGSNAWLPSFLILYRGWNIIEAGLILSLFWAAMAMGRLGLARVSERIGYGKMILICGSISLASISLGIAANSLIPVIVLWCITGFCFGPIFPVILAWASSCFPENTGISSGVIMTVATLGPMFSPWLIGAIAQTYTLQQGMIVLPSLILVMLLTATRAANRAPKQR
jgi:fucose permease